MDDFEIELKQDFLTEATDLLESAETSFLELEGNHNNKDLLNKIFRATHNLKGSSQAVGFMELSALTHLAETVILKLREGELDVDDSIVSALLEFKDKVVEIIEGLKKNFDFKFDTSEISGKLEQYARGVEESRSLQPKEEISREQGELLFDFGGDSDDKASQNEELESDFISLSEDIFEEKRKDIEVLDEDFITESGMSIASLFSLKEIGVELGPKDADVLKRFEKGNTTTKEEQEHLDFLFSDQSDSLVSNRPSSESEANTQIDSNVVSEKNLDQSDLDALFFEKNEVEEKTELRLVAKPDTPAKEIRSEGESTKRGILTDESIRVKLSRIDEINNVIGELVILQTVVNQQKNLFVKDELMINSITMMNKLFKEVQELAMSLRMLPIKGVFQKMNRVVRDTSLKLEKNINLKLVGEDTEVDKTVLEKISDPLIHLVRNAVDHGLESQAERATTSKDEEGTIELMSFHEGNTLVIQVTDDGRGIDPEILHHKAVEMGIVSKAVTLTNQQKLNLIFHPGLSTKDSVTDISGRGVGMDVVKSNIESLGGEVKLQSKPGIGSSFKIILPLTLAIIEGIIIKSEEEKYVIPLSQVSEVTQVLPTSIERFSNGNQLFELRGKVLPIFFINNKVGNKVGEKKRHTVIIVRGMEYPIGVVVDDILNQQQIVIKKLGEDLRNKKGMIGSAIMTDGLPALILDLHETYRDDLKKNRSYEKYKRKLIDAA